MPAPELSRLAWRCRRGIKEMDLLFESYLQQYYPHLAKADQAHFEALLEEADLDIYDWIIERSIPERTAYLPLLKQLRSLQEK